MLIQMLINCHCFGVTTIKMRFWGFTTKHCQKIWKALTGNFTKLDDCLAHCTRLHRAGEHTCMGAAVKLISMNIFSQC